MLSIKTSSHIRNMRNVKRYRSGHTSTGVSMSHEGKGMIYFSRKSVCCSGMSAEGGLFVNGKNTFPIQGHVLDIDCIV